MHFLATRNLKLCRNLLLCAILPILLIMLCHEEYQYIYKRSRMNTRPHFVIVSITSIVLFVISCTPTTPTDLATISTKEATSSSTLLTLTATPSKPENSKVTAYPEPLDSLIPPDTSTIEQGYPYPDITLPNEQQARSKDNIVSCNFTPLSTANIKTDIYSQSHTVTQHELNLRRLKIIDWVGETQSILITYNTEDKKHISLLDPVDMSVTSLAENKLGATPIFDHDANRLLYLDTAYLDNPNSAITLNTLTVSQNKRASSETIIGKLEHPYFALLPDNQVTTFAPRSTALVSYSLTNGRATDGTQWHEGLPITRSGGGIWPKITTSPKGNFAIYGQSSPFLIYDYKKSSFCNLNLGYETRRVLAARWSPDGQKLALVMDEEPFGALAKTLVSAKTLLLSGKLNQARGLLATLLAIIFY